ncbi:MAG: phosphate transport system regulatory protein PhoU [Bdellovibrionales bacterium GWB1_55_8]|nr:MAG: phosphate transport system regulatory protein PhoU [Bdellovibrionales bacterium GWB1_55_8]
MERHFETSLRELKVQLVAMASHVERAIGNAIEGLQNGDFAAIASVYSVEETINRENMDLDGSCVRLLALQQPLAADLRLLIAVIKINTDLERMGDQAVNIAQDAEAYLKGAPLKPLIDLPKMFMEVQGMVRESINSFVNRDEKLARDVLKRDDVVDGLKAKIINDVTEILKTRPTDVRQGLHLILIARHLERIGDHATNIAEDVIYAISGKDVRHGGST